MMGLFWSIDISLSAVSAAIMGVVFAFYIKRFMEFRSRLAFGLAVFSGLLFAQTLISSVVYYIFAQTYTAAIAVPLMFIIILELAGFLSLVYVVGQ